MWDQVEGQRPRASRATLNSAARSLSVRSQPGALGVMPLLTRGQRKTVMLQEIGFPKLFNFQRLIKVKFNPLSFAKVIFFLPELL